jgi:hypothetical protein
MSSGGSGSSFEFGNNYLFNYKNTKGNVNEICTYYSTDSYANTVSKSAFLNGSGGSFTARVTTLTSLDEWFRSSSTYTVYVALGSSSTEPTYDDYTLGSLITSYSQDSAAAPVTRNDDGTYTIDYRIIITATADITVREIGIFKPIAHKAATYSSDYNSYYALLNRMVLDEPITIASGESANVSFSITTPKISISQ